MCLELTKERQGCGNLHRLVLSRVLGRSRDIGFSLPLKSAVRADGTQINLDDALDEEQNLNKLDGACSTEDFAWLASEQCWICERWSYYLPLVTREELEACADDVPLQTSKLVKLQPSQERAFDALVKLNAKQFS